MIYLISAFNYAALKGKIVEKYGSQGAFARALGLSERSLSLKLNNQVPFTQQEMIRSVLLFGESAEAIRRYFFTCNVQLFELND